MSPMSPGSGLQPPRNCHRMGMIPGSSMVEHSAVNRRVASSNLARGAKFSFFLNYLQTAIFPNYLFEPNCHENVTLLAFRTAACWLYSLHAGLARPFPTGSDVWFPGCCGAWRAAQPRPEQLHSAAYKRRDVRCRSEMLSRQLV